jgi:hypothetical protein
MTTPVIAEVSSSDGVIEAVAARVPVNGAPRMCLRLQISQ